MLLRGKLMRACYLPIALCVLAGRIYGQDGITTQSTPRGEGWMLVHQAYIKQAKERGKTVELVFLGDSITQAWNDTGTPTWERFYVPRNVLNLGIGGDRTEHVLWRLDNGEVDDLKPKVVVLMIGTNNIGRNSDREVVKGVTAVVERLRAKLPGAKVLLLGIFPRGENVDRALKEAPVDARVSKINAALAKLDDDKTVEYLDIGNVLLNEKGQVTRSIMPDHLHLNRKGYRTWADAMEPTLWKLMEGKRGL
jgi:beta-glucosidase